MNPITKAAGLFCTVVALGVFGVESAAAIRRRTSRRFRRSMSWEKAYNAGNADGIGESSTTNRRVLLPPGAPPSVAVRRSRRSSLRTRRVAKGRHCVHAWCQPAGGVSGDMGWQSGIYEVKDKSGQGRGDRQVPFRFRGRRAASGSTSVTPGMPTAHRPGRRPRRPRRSSHLRKSLAPRPDEARAAARSRHPRASDRATAAAAVARAVARSLLPRRSPPFGAFFDRAE